jgi:ABC-type branched-subunit amino acid transport system substrate-binding protein
MLGATLFAHAARGAETAPPPEAQLAFNQAMDAYGEARWSDSFDQFNSLLTRFPWTSLTQEIMFRKAFCLNRMGRYEAGRAAFRVFLEHYPTSRFTRQSTVELAFAETKLGNASEATQMLRPILPALTDDEKKEEVLALEVVAPNLAPPGLDTNVASYASLDEIHRIIGEVKANKPGALQQLDAVIDHRTSFLDVARLYAEADTGSPAWGLIAAKMARIRLHLGDLDGAKEAADRAIPAGAGGHLDAMQEIVRRAQERAAVKPNLVGVILPLSGRFKQFGDQLQQGLGLALAPTDNIQFITRDSQGDAQLAVTAVDDLAAQGVIAIIGPVGAAEAFPAAVRAQELGVPMISLSRAEGVTDAGDFIFRNSLTNSAQGRALAHYAAEVLGAKHAAILAPDIPAGQEVTDPFWDDFESRGGSVRGYQRYAQDQTTFSEPLGKLIVHVADKDQLKDDIARIKATVSSPYRQKKLIEKLLRNAPPVIDFDVLLIPDYYKTVLQIAPALAVEDVITNGCDPQEMDRIKKTTKRDEIKTVTLLGTPGWNSPDLITRGGRYVQCAVFVDGFYVNSEREPTRRFVAAFREKYGQDPGLLQAQAYDTARMIRDVIVNRPTATRDGFRQALGGIQRFPGATGETTFAPNREADKPLFFLTVEKTGLRELPVLISPEGVAAHATAARP